METITNKSLERYVEECVSNFNYSDFSPPIAHHELILKFYEILNKENAYWEEFKPEDKWPQWIFIQFKSHTSSPHILLGLNFANNRIAGVLTQSLTHQALIDPNNRAEINLVDIWLDHNKLFQFLYPIIKEGIQQSNSQ